MKNIRNIIFDLGGVLLPINFAAVLESFNKLGDSVDTDFYSQQKQIPVFDRLERGESTPAEFLFELKKNFPNASDQDLTLAWNAILGTFPQNRFELLEKVRRHYRIFLLSNTNGIHVQQFLADMKANNNVEDFASYFEELYYSHETGFRKPERQIYELVLLENNLNAAETLFIEDTEANVHGAVAAGIPTLWLKVKEGEKIENVFDHKGNLKEDLSIIYPA